MLPFIFAMFYFIGDTATTISQLATKDMVSIATGICIALFYLTKTYKVYFVKDKLSELEGRIKVLEEIIKRINP